VIRLATITIWHFDAGWGAVTPIIFCTPNNSRDLHYDALLPRYWDRLGTALIQAGKARKGVHMLQHGMRLSPLGNRLAYWGTILANALLRLRRVEQAEREARLACTRDDKLYMAKGYHTGHASCAARAHAVAPA
jgi:hypothetical protein